MFYLTNVKLCHVSVIEDMIDNIINMFNAFIISCLSAVRLDSAFFMMAGLCTKTSTALNSLISIGDQLGETQSRFCIKGSMGRLKGRVYLKD